MEIQRTKTKNSETILRTKNNFEGLTYTDLKTYSKSTVIKGTSENKEDKFDFIINDILL